MNDIWCDLTDMSAENKTLVKKLSGERQQSAAIWCLSEWLTALLFSKSNTFLIDTLIRKIIGFDNKNKNNRVDLADVSVIIKALLVG